MPLFLNHHNTLHEVKEKPFKLERDIQKLFEANLATIMGLELVKSEFTIKNKRIDTLAFDPESKSFIIIEYKRDKNHSVVDQGFTYLGLMLENKADFIVEYNETLAGDLKRESVDWSQTRVVLCRLVLRTTKSRQLTLKISRLSCGRSSSTKMGRL
jgi:hypothetical protein